MSNVNMKSVNLFDFEQPRRTVGKTDMYNNHWGGIIKKDHICWFFFESIMCSNTEVNR